MRMVAGFALIALSLFVLFAEVMTLLDAAGPAGSGAHWYDHAVWLLAAATLFAVGSWMARDWRRTRRTT